MTTPQGFAIRIIGERINPGFKSTKAMFDDKDLEAIQALATRQVESGAAYLNVNVGARALTDLGFMAEVIEAIQAVATVPLSFDFPSVKVQEFCLAAYDQGRALRRRAAARVALRGCPGAAPADARLARAAGDLARRTSAPESTIDSARQGKRHSRQPSLSPSGSSDHSNAKHSNSSAAALRRHCYGLPGRSRDVGTGQ